MQIPDMLKNVKELLERGVEEGITFAKETLDMSKGPFEKLQKDGGENITNSDFYQMFSRKDFSKQVAAEYIENKILPAYKELEEYILWKQHKKLNRLKKILRAPGTGVFEKVHKDTMHKKIQCETGASCVGWDKECFEGIFGRCGAMDPFEIWKRHVREKDYD